jgi:hypothetical protein
VDEAVSPPKNDPFTLFQPRDIFALPGKRSRHDFDTDAPLTAPEAEERATRQVHIPNPGPKPTPAPPLPLPLPHPYPYPWPDPCPYPCPSGGDP